MAIEVFRHTAVPKVPPFSQLSSLRLEDIAASRQRTTEVLAVPYKPYGSFHVTLRSFSSGGRSFRNAPYSTKSYVTLVPPPITSGAENARFCITRPAMPDPTAQRTLRARLLKPLPNVLSFGRTIAAT